MSPQLRVERFTVATLPSNRFTADSYLDKPVLFQSLAYFEVFRVDPLEHFSSSIAPSTTGQTLLTLDQQWGLYKVDHKYVSYINVPAVWGIR